MRCDQQKSYGEDICSSWRNPVFDRVSGYADWLHSGVCRNLRRASHMCFNSCGSISAEAMRMRGTQPNARRQTHGGLLSTLPSRFLRRNPSVLLAAVALWGIICGVIGCGGGSMTGARGNSISGSAITQTLSVSPSSLGFGNVVVNTNSTVPVVVTDVGSSSVTVSQVTTTGTGFSVTGPTLPLTLSAGQNASFIVMFAPTASGIVTGNLSIVSNATDSPNLDPLSATAVNQHSVTLNWVASTSPNITGYNVYRGAVSGGPYTQINSSLVTVTTYSDTTVQSGETYYYVTTAVDSQGVGSGDSNQATILIPSP